MRRLRAIDGNQGLARVHVEGIRGITRLGGSLAVAEIIRRRIHCRRGVLWIIASSFALASRNFLLIIVWNVVVRSAPME